MVDPLRAVATGGLIALAGVLIGQMGDIPPEAHIVAAIFLAMLVVVLGIDLRRFRWFHRLQTKEEGEDG